MTTSKAKTLPVSPVNGDAARDNAVRWSHNPNSPDRTRLCLKFVREMWGLPLVYGSAKEAYDNAVVVAVTDVNKIPVGAPVFSRRKDAPDDFYHVFITGGWWKDEKGRRHRVFWSTDIKGLGEVHATSIKNLVEKWDHEILGWAKTLNGYTLDYSE